MSEPTKGPYTRRGQEIFAADGTCIAYVRYNGEEGDPESEATGDLLVAAPDLLEALKEVLLECQVAAPGPQYRWHNEYYDAINKASAAVVKAEGT